MNFMLKAIIASYYVIKIRAQKRNKVFFFKAFINKTWDYELLGLIVKRICTKVFLFINLIKRNIKILSI